ncbi:hypothetical protein L5515_002442 [Caenorhabditis briggsae]|uniref:Domain of unknown function WSN domain-containing protein n=1 Tax=Caenorhabditis briggsae TaxID=6238 RepID=A0AAE9J5P0_CAEBR|nr:hypothetical protein L5515_002442 [Caenorhabditis briggsae]
MISLICLALSIYVVWLCLAETNNSVLSPIIEKSASLARISAAISIHNGIHSEQSIVQEVTAEFLDISPSVAKELLEHDYRSLSDNMEKFYGSLSKIPAKLKNGDELIKTINLLLDMKVNEEYLKTGAIGDQTAHFKNITEVMKTSASKTIKKLGPFREDLIGASNDTEKIKKAVNEILKYSESIQHVFPTTIFLNSTALKYEEKVITSGLLGYKDLDNIWTDFENPWFRQNVLSNLDPTILKEGLDSLKSFVSALDSLIPSKLFDDENEKKTTLDLAKKISEIHEIGLKVKNATNSKTPYEEASACIKPLKPIQNPPDPDMLQKVEDFSGKVVQTVKAFSKLMDEINENGLESILAVSEEIRTNIEFVTETRNDTMKMDMWNKAHKLEKDHNLAKNLQSIYEMLTEVGKRKWFLEDRKIDYNVIRTVSTVFEGTNVESVLNCIQRSSVDNLIGMLGFVDHTDSLMNQKTEFKTATNFIKNLLKMQTNFQNVIKKTKSAKVSKESQALIDSNHFKKIGTNSKVIGGSVAAIRAIDSVSNAEKSIRSVVEMESDVKFEIQKVLGLKSTDELVNEMNLAQNSVGEILKVLKTKRIDSISDFQSTFISLLQLKNQTDIEDDNIPNLALEMSNQTDPKLQSLAKEFQAISKLDLRFMSHQKSFDVKNSLETTKNMLVNFLQTSIDEKDAGRRRSMENSSNSNYLTPILISSLVIGLVATAVICFICWYRGFGCWHFVENGDFESGNHGKARKRKFGFRKNDKTQSKSKMSKPKENEKKTEDGEKKEDPKKKSKISQISRIPKSAEQ